MCDYLTALFYVICNGCSTESSEFIHPKLSPSLIQTLNIPAKELHCQTVKTVGSRLSSSSDFVVQEFRMKFQLLAPFNLEKLELSAHVWYDVQ